MKAKLLYICLTFSFAAGCGPGAGFQISSINPSTDISAPAAAAAYELYSWPHEDTWAYAVFESATKISSREYIMKDNLVSYGTDAFIEELIRLPRGAKVYWNLKRIKGFSLPDEKTREKILHAARKANINIEIIAWPY
ncbi:MAG: hypothetical protein LBG46_02530 [Elusimicrobiota bacterium]|jgi:hypothetical protein|nr:hypothetical protein [Elusimicrobiota bacterium]